jgi:hypothetical protein
LAAIKVDGNRTPVLGLQDCFTAVAIDVAAQLSVTKTDFKQLEILFVIFFNL